jgi:uncharacterized protein YxjI
MSISGRKKVFDMQGNHIFSIRKEHLHIHTTFSVESPAGDKLVEVKNSITCKYPALPASFAKSRG